MAANTKIQWATHTFNPWRGCVKIAAGCANCYAETQSKRNPATLGVWGPHGTRVVASEAMWREPLKWNRNAGAAHKGRKASVSGRDDGEGQAYESVAARPRVFCASLADVFEDWEGIVRNSKNVPMHSADKWLRGKPGSGGAAWLAVPNQFVGQSLIRLDDVRARLFATIDETPNLDWLLLTKRPENIRRMWVPYGPNAADGEMDEWRDNVWLGVSIACRDDLRLLDELRRCRDLCAKIFVSAEPLLEDLGEIDLTGIDWVIIGGESGPNARPCHVDWLRSIVRQCKAAGVPPFVKQAGAVPYVDDVCRDKWALSHDRRQLGPGLGYRILIRDKKGGDLSELPEDLRVREVPS